ncbi:MAG: histidinol-phosphate transaminase [Oscillospiraceae bacterium]|nr:histidinol-phosphate transaminase [Oscillospiraceae bacterium]
MSRFFSAKYASLQAYTPGEQPRDAQYVKLNTNESPFPPAPAVIAAAAQEAERLNLYCDPACTELCKAAARLYGLEPENVLPVNGSDEILCFSFMAFGDERHPFAFPDVTYGFYPVYANVNHVPAHIIPLRADFSIDPADYCGLGENIVIPNPNAPTGMALSVSQIEKIVRTNPDSVVIIDEAYVDFGGESCIPLLGRYENLLVTQTFSKSRSLAGARLGFGLGSPALIRDLNTVKYSVNPYNVNRMTQAAGVAAIESLDYYQKNCMTIAENRAYTTQALAALGFETLPSLANFIFTQSPAIPGGALYQALKERGVLVRHFDQARISNFIRVTIGSRPQMDAFLDTVRAILEERGL